MMREILNHIQALVASSEDRFTKARELARIIRDRGQYRWVGVYDVGLEQVAIISWSGPGAPAYPTFSIKFQERCVRAALPLWLTRADG